MSSNGMMYDIDFWAKTPSENSNIAQCYVPPPPVLPPAPIEFDGKHTQSVRTASNVPTTVASSTGGSVPDEYSFTDYTRTISQNRVTIVPSLVSNKMRGPLPNPVKPMIQHQISNASPRSFGDFTVTPSQASDPPPFPVWIRDGVSADSSAALVSSPKVDNNAALPTLLSAEPLNAVKNSATQTSGKTIHFDSPAPDTGGKTVHFATLATDAGSPRKRIDTDLTSNAFSVGIHGCVESQPSAHTNASRVPSQKSTKSAERYQLSVTSGSTKAESAIDLLSREYVQLSMAYPICVVLLGTTIAVLLTVLGVATIPMDIDTSFETFLKTDVESSVMRDSFVAAMESRVQSRRLSNKGLKFELNDNDATTWTLNATDSDLMSGVSGSGSHARKLSGYVVKDLYIAYEASAESSSKGLFEDDTLTAISTFEQTLRAVPKWEELCSRVDEPYRRLCKPGITFVNIATPTSEIPETSIVPTKLVLDGHGRDLVPLQTSLALAWKQEINDVIFPLDVTEAPGAPGSVSSSTLLRSAFRFRLPAEESAQWESFMLELIPLLKEGCKCKKFKVYFDGTDLLGIQVKHALNSDIRLSACGAIFVLAYLCFHTRSVLLAVTGLLFTMLSVPLSFVFSAIIAGTTTVSFASFMSLFLVIGFGSDVIFVYTDFWRDSATHCTSKEERLHWTLKYATRASLATSGTTALSFFANLASAIRALREFGFFMGLCVMTVWVLITCLYLPICVIDEEYFSKFHLCDCWAKAKHVDETSDSQRETGFVRWSQHIYRWRRSWCSLPILASVGCALWAGSSMTLMSGMPNIFGDSHNTVAGNIVMLQFQDPFVAFPSSFEPPPEAEDVCSEQFFGGDDSSQCALYWCESSSSSAFGLDDGSCQCSRRERPPSSCKSSSSTAFEVVQRFVHPNGMSGAQFENAVESYWESNDDNLEFPFSDSKAVKVPVSAAPMIQQEWETGLVSLARITETRVTLQKTENTTVEACGWEDLCHCGRQICRMSGTWAAGPRIQVGNGRRASMISSIVAPTTEDGGRRLGRQFLPRQPPSVATPPRNLQAAQNTVVQVAFGLKVQRSMPVLGTASMPWEFLDGFDLGDPWSQRQINTFCDFPGHLRVKQKRCWVQDFKNFLDSSNIRWPPHRGFDDLALHFIATGNTQTSGTEYIWLYGKKVKAIMVAVEVDVPATVPSAMALEYKQHWDSYVDSFNENSVDEAVGAFHTSALWVAAEILDALFLGTAWTLVILLGLAFVGMLVFTRSLVLSLYVVLSTIIVMMMLAFYIVIVEGWELGLIEVIAMIYFIGYAVTYSLHVAHKYAGSNALEEDTPLLEPMPKSDGAKVRLQRTSFSLKAIGGAALGSAATTAGTSLFLVFCDLKIFTKLGCMCLAVTTMSIVVALGPLPAMLMIRGPMNPGCSPLLKALFDRLNHHRPTFMDPKTILPW